MLTRRIDSARRMLSVQSSHWGSQTSEDYQKFLVGWIHLELYFNWLLDQLLCNEKKEKQNKLKNNCLDYNTLLQYSLNKTYVNICREHNHLKISVNNELNLFNILSRQIISVWPDGICYHPALCVSVTQETLHAYLSVSLFTIVPIWVRPSSFHSANQRPFSVAISQSEAFNFSCVGPQTFYHRRQDTLYEKKQRCSLLVFINIHLPENIHLYQKT